MNRLPNKITRANAGGPRQLPMRTHGTARVAQFWRWAATCHFVFGNLARVAKSKWRWGSLSPKPVGWRRVLSRRWSAMVREVPDMPRLLVRPSPNKTCQPTAVETVSAR